MTEAEQRRLERRAGEIAADLRADFPAQSAMLVKNLRRYLAVLRLIEPYLRAPDRPRVLDYGCGYPLLLKLLQEMNCAATGYEPHADETHRQVARRLGVEDQYGQRLDDSAAFDLVLLVDVIEHLSILGPTMRDVVARVRPGGRLAISTPNGLRFDLWQAYVRRKTAHPTSIQKFLRTDNNYVHHQREFTLEELKVTARFYGLEVVETRIEDTQPERRDLQAYHQLLADGPDYGAAGFGSRLKDFIRRRLPASWQNNLLLVARKPPRPT